MRERWVYNSGKNRIKGSCPDNWEHYNFNNERWECGKDRKINMKTRGRKYDSRYHLFTLYELERLD